MIFYKLGRREASTILEGIASFIESGTYPLAIIIFVASFIVPLGKILVLVTLMVKTLNPDRRRPVRTTRAAVLLFAGGPRSPLAAQGGGTGHVAFPVPEFDRLARPRPCQQRT